MPFIVPKDSKQIAQNSISTTLHRMVCSHQMSKSLKASLHEEINMVHSYFLDEELGMVLFWFSGYFFDGHCVLHDGEHK